MDTFEELRALRRDLDELRLRFMTAPNSENTHWNAEVYERIGTPMRRWAQAVIDDLQLRGDETAIDNNARGNDETR